MKAPSHRGGEFVGARRGVTPVTAPRIHPVRGFTLVELMVGLAVGLFVALAAISVFVSTRVLQTVNTAESRMGENARLAMDLLQNDFRGASFAGCAAKSAEPTISALNPDPMFLDGASWGLGGSHGDGAAHTPAPPATLAGLARPPKVDSDIVSVRVPMQGVSFGLRTPMASQTGVPNLGFILPSINPLVTGDVVLIANCKGSTIFQITGGGGILLQHAVGAGAPGNATLDLQQAFQEDAAVYRIRTHHYYIADSAMAGANGTTSLWRYGYPNLDGSPQEMVQGIERMVVTYGIDDGTVAGIGVVNRYVTADAVADWASVVAMRVQLLSSTVRDGVTMAPRAASFAGSSVIPVDRRLRAQLTEVVTLRGRAP